MKSNSLQIFKKIQDKLMNSSAVYLIPLYVGIIAIIKGAELLSEGQPYFSGIILVVMGSLSAVYAWMTVNVLEERESRYEV